MINDELNINLPGGQKRLISDVLTLDQWLDLDFTRSETVFDEHVLKESLVKVSEAFNSQSHLLTKYLLILDSRNILELSNIQYIASNVELVEVEKIKWKPDTKIPDFYDDPVTLDKALKAFIAHYMIFYMGNLIAILNTHLPVLSVTEANFDEVFTEIINMKDRYVSTLNDDNRAEIEQNANVLKAFELIHSELYSRIYIYAKDYYARNAGVKPKLIAFLGGATKAIFYVGYQALKEIGRDSLIVLGVYDLWVLDIAYSPMKHLFDYAVHLFSIPADALDSRVSKEGVPAEGIRSKSSYRSTINPNGVLIPFDGITDSTLTFSVRGVRNTTLVFNGLGSNMGLNHKIVDYSEDIRNIFIQEKNNNTYKPRLLYGLDMFWFISCDSSDIIPGVYYSDGRQYTMRDVCSETLSLNQIAGVPIGTITAPDKSLKLLPFYHDTKLGGSQASRGGLNNNFDEYSDAFGVTSAKFHDMPLISSKDFGVVQAAFGTNVAAGVLAVTNLMISGVSTFKLGRSSSSYARTQSSTSLVTAQQAAELRVQDATTSAAQARTENNIRQVQSIVRVHARTGNTQNVLDKLPGVGNIVGAVRSIQKYFEVKEMIRKESKLFVTAINKALDAWTSYVDPITLTTNSYKGRFFNQFNSYSAKNYINFGFRYQKSTDTKPELINVVRALVANTYPHFFLQLASTVANTTQNAAILSALAAKSIGAEAISTAAAIHAKYFIDEEKSSTLPYIKEHESEYKNNRYKSSRKSRRQRRR